MLLWGAWGKASEETWCGCVSVGSVSGKGLLSQLRWCRCDFQSGSWMMRQGSFLNRNLSKTHQLGENVGFQGSMPGWISQSQEQALWGTVESTCLVNLGTFVSLALLFPFPLYEKFSLPGLCIVFPWKVSVYLWKLCKCHCAHVKNLTMAQKVQDWNRFC